MDAEEIPLSSEQLQIVGMAIAVVLVTVSAPILFAPGSNAPAEANNGTVYEPDTEPQTPDPAPTDSGSDTDNNPIQRVDYEGNLDAVPETHVSAANHSEPDVSASAGAQTLRVSATTVDGEPALNLTDDREHAGRWVSVSKDWLVSEYGDVPDVVGIAHEDGSTYSESVRLRGGQAVFWVRGFSTNVVTFGGVLEIVGQPATTGTTHLYEIRDLDNATDPSVQLTGQVNSETDIKDATALTDGDSVPLSVAGDTLQPTNAEVTFTGREQLTTNSTLFDTTLSDGGTTSYTVDGNVPAQNVSVEFTGKSTSSTRTVSKNTVADGGTISYNVSGNLPATNAGVTFTGTSPSTTSSSGSGTGSGSVSVNGNLDPTDESVSVTGRVATTNGVRSESGVGLSHTRSLDYDGNVPAQGPSSNNKPELTVTADGTEDTTNIYDRVGGGFRVGRPAVGEKNGNVLDSSIQIEPTTSGKLTSITPYTEDIFGTEFAVDLYIIQESGDTNHNEASNKIGTWDPNGLRNETINIDNPPTVSANTIYTIEFRSIDTTDGDSIDILTDTDEADRFYRNSDALGLPDVDYTVTGSANNVDASDGADVSKSIGDLSDGQSSTVEFPVDTDSTEIDFSGSGSASLDYTLDMDTANATEDPSIDVDGDGTAEASWTGVYGSGESSTTKSVDGLTTGSNSISTSTTVGAQPEWSLSWTERTATENPSIDLDSDGTTDATYSGILTNGETATSDVGDLSTGSETATVSTAAHTTDVAIEFDEITATENPSIDLDSDGTTDATYSGVLKSGETATSDVGDLSTGSKTATASTAAHTVGIEAASTERTATNEPQLDVDNDGAAEASYAGVLYEGETANVSINEFDLSVTDATAMLTNGSVDATISYTERVRTKDAGVIVNGETVRMDGTLNDEETTSLTANSSWLQSGENNVTVLAGDGSLSTDAPDRTVGLTYEHELSTRRSVTYEAEAFSERYNISRTYLSDRQHATLTIPHAENVISMRTMEARINETGGWSTIPESGYELNGTTLEIDISALTGGEVAADTTVEIRSTGSKVDVYNGSISVLDATPVGFDLNSRVTLSDWASDSYLSVHNSSQSELVHFGANESYTAESDYAELSTRHDQRVHFPGATSGSEVGIRALPVILTPENGTVRATVPESQVNETAPQFYVDPGATSGEAFTVEYAGATSGEWYGVYELDTTKRFDRRQGPGTMTVPRDDIESLLQIRGAPAPESNPDGAATIFGAAEQGNLLSLIALFGSIAMLFIIGQRPDRSRDVVNSVASRSGSLAGRVPRIGGVLDAPIESGITGVGEAIVTLGENTLLTSAVGAAALVAAVQSGFIDIGPELGAMLSVAGIAVGSLVALRRAEAFTTARWIAIVGVSGVIALQALGEGDLLTALVDSDAFILVLLIAAYAVVQLVREYRANNSPDDDQPQVNIITRRGGDD
jgi:hypothetical protein